MDCNKDEAIRAKEIAVRKFSEKDVIGAAKFALKAQKLYPELEGISRLVANFELHMSAKFRRNGEIDWYRMLGVSPSADTDTITKQYRKMALLIHPDKNREVGSESAFKLLSEAFRVLKDKTFRSAYDQRTNIQTFQQNAPTHAQFVPVVPTVPTAFPQTGYSAAPGWSQFKHSVGTQKKHSGAQPSWNCSKTSSNNSTPQQQGPTVGGGSGQPPRPVNNGKRSTAGPHKRVKKSDHKLCSSIVKDDNEERSSFWTSCTGCKMKFEYLSVFLNQHLCCQNCKAAFQAMEIPIPSTWLNSEKHFSFSRHQNPSQLDGSSVVNHAGSSALHAADKGKPSRKRLNQGCADADASNGNLGSKGQKLDDNVMMKPTMINNGKKGKTNVKPKK